MTRLSIIIPWVSDDRSHEDTLASVLANRPAQSEILVVHPGRYSDPYELGEEVHFLEADKAADRLALLNLGADEADGDILHVLAGGVEVTEGWADAALREFDRAEVVSVAPLVTDEEERVLSAGVRASRSGRRILCHGKSPRSTELAKQTPLGPSLIAGFYRVEAWDAAGGLDEAVGSAADLDLAFCLQQLGACRVATSSLVCLNDSGVLAAERGFRHGRAAMRVHRRFAAKQGFSNSLFWVQALFGFAARCYSPTAWGELLGQLASRNDRRDADRFEQRWSELQEEAVELQREIREAA